MATSSHPNFSSIPYIPKVVLNPTPISYAPPRTEAVPGTTKPIPAVPVGEQTDSAKIKKGKRPRSNEGSPAGSTESKRAKKPKSNEESPSVSSEWKRPDWLPEGWEVKEVIRQDGKSAGSKDKYYIEPGTGKRFRSLAEVRRHLGLDPPKTNERKPNSPKSKSSDPISSNLKESKKRKVDKETAVNGEEK